MAFIRRMKMYRCFKVSLSKCLIFGVTLITLLNTLVLFSCRFLDSGCPMSSNYKESSKIIPIPSDGFETDKISKSIQKHADSIHGSNDPDNKGSKIQNKPNKKERENDKPKENLESSNQGKKNDDDDPYKDMRVDGGSKEKISTSFITKDHIIAGVEREDHAFLVIGVPTVKRGKASYLTQTIRGLIQGLDESERTEVIIVVMATDSDPNAVITVADEISTAFVTALSSGLLRVVKAPSSFYPSLEKLPRLYGDKADRVRWRSKQALDYAFLFRYCKDLGKYYLQVEDDVSTSVGYVKKIKGFISIRQNRKWSILEFGARGFIGMMYRTSDLGRLSTFVKMYYWVAPVDLLYRQFNDFNLYGTQQWAKCTPLLFRHIGSFSSLDGQVRMLEDIRSGHRIYKDNDNPEAEVTTSIGERIRRTSISAVYDTVHHGIFWGKNIKEGDFVLLEFREPVRVVKFIVESGGAQAPEDYFGAARIMKSLQNADGKCDDYTEWKGFNDVAQLKVESSDPKGTPCQCLKIEVTGLRRDIKGKVRWLAIREIAVWTTNKDSDISPNQ